MLEHGMTQNAQGIWRAPDNGKVPFWAKVEQDGAAEEVSA
jgi:hypothetical protein